MSIETVFLNKYLSFGNVSQVEVVQKLTVQRNDFICDQVFWYIGRTNTK